MMSIWAIRGHILREKALKMFFMIKRSECRTLGEAGGSERGEGGLTSESEIAGRFQRCARNFVMAAASRMILVSAERASTSSRAGAVLAICLSAESRCQSVLTSFGLLSPCPGGGEGTFEEGGGREERARVGCSLISVRRKSQQTSALNARHVAAVYGTSGIFTDLQSYKPWCRGAISDEYDGGRCQCFDIFCGGCGRARLQAPYGILVDRPRTARLAP